MNDSRTKNAVLNILCGVVVQILNLAILFIGRAVFAHFLDVSYLGINGLYSNIFSVLALAELGLGNVIQFFLYKPVLLDDKERINSLVKYFRKLYFIIAGVIFGAGVALIPTLKYIVNSDLSDAELIFYYVLFLINSVVSYFSAHNIALLAAYQDTRLQKYTVLITNFVAQIVQIFVLVYLHSYAVYVVVTVLATGLNVVIINSICNSRFKNIFSHKAMQPSDEDKHYIIDNIKSTFVYKIGATIINNTDNILISMIISTAAVGYYSNYYMVVMAIQGFITIITNSLISAVGNLSASGNVKRMQEVFNVMLLIYHAIAAFGAISFYYLFDDLIPLWLGERFLLDRPTTFAIAFSFYLTNSISPIWMFREANGLFDKVKYLLLATASVNIIFSIILGKYFGMMGILLATSIARIVTQVWYEPKIIYSNIFKSSQSDYWKKEFKYVFITILAMIASGSIIRIMQHGFGWMIIKGCLIGVICSCFFAFGTRNTDEFKELARIIKRIFRNGIR